jgi:hypothetical protein
MLSSEGSASKVVVGVSEKLGSLGGVKSMFFAQVGVSFLSCYVYQSLTLVFHIVRRS